MENLNQNEMKTVTGTGQFTSTGTIDHEAPEANPIAPLFVEDISQCEDESKMYVLPDGYIYAYYSKSVPTAPNLFEPDNEDYTHIQRRLYYNTTQGVTPTETLADTTEKTGSLVSWAGGMTTNYMSADYSSFNGNSKMTISGFSGNAVDVFGTETGGSPIMFFDADKKYIGFRLIYTGSGSWAFTDAEVDDENHSITFSLDTMKSVISTVYNNSVSDVLNNTKYIRFSCMPTGSNANITAEDIENINVSFDANKVIAPVLDWWNTGISYTTSNYENQILSIQTTSDNHEERIDAIEEILDDPSYPLPNYWESEVETIIDTVKQKHSQFGKDCVSFVFAADMHIESKNLPNYQFSQNIGKIAARVMDECDIPFMIVAGDNNSGAAVISETPEYIYADVELQDKILKPVGIERVLKLLGNHDGTWGQTTTGGSTVYYDRSVSMEERFNLFMAPQGIDSRRVWGDNGTYFYIDYPQRKTRFICLNSQDITYHVGDDYFSTDTPAKNPMKEHWYSTEQLEWLADVLDSSDGMNIIISTHVPPTTMNITGCDAENDDILRGIISAYCNKSTYSSGDISVNYASASGTVVGIFSGHKHFDYTDNSTLPCPIIITTTAGNAPQEDPDGNKAVRTYGTVNETAFDVVTVDTSGKTIYFTRIGNGSDRVVSYSSAEDA